MVLYGTQDLGQLSGAELAGSTGPVAVLGETYLGHPARLSRPVDRPGRAGLALHLDHVGDDTPRFGLPRCDQASASSPIGEAGVIG